MIRNSCGCPLAYPAIVSYSRRLFPLYQYGDSHDSLPDTCCTYTCIVRYARDIEE